MKKVLLSIGIFGLLIILSGCQKKVEYKFMYDQSEINTIEIIRVGEADESGVNEQEVLTSIDDINSFVDEFTQLTCYDHVGDPTGVYPDQIAIKVTYKNSEYELIAAGGQAHYTMKRQYVNYDGFYYFNKEEFNNFLRSNINEQDAQ